MDKDHLEDLATFVRQQRSNESNFESLYQKLEEEASSSNANQTYVDSLKEIGEKWGEEYRTAKNKGGSAWPEFEKFVAEFEKAIVEALKTVS